MGFYNNDNLVNHIRHENPEGRGRPYNIASLCSKLFGGTSPKRLTYKTRLKLAFYFDEHSIGYDNLLNELSKTTRLWVLTRH